MEFTPETVLLFYKKPSIAADQKYFNGLFSIGSKLVSHLFSVMTNSSKTISTRFHNQKFHSTVSLLALENEQ